jgi:endonuclease/exonuclease/phosphatase family metal-dependent hydrolase
MGELRLLTYNVRSLRDDAAAVASMIRSCAPDVACVQEAPRFLRWRSKRAALARMCGLVVATADRPGGLMLMTTVAVQARRTSFTLLPKSSGLHQRAVCAAELELRGDRWSVASAHFSTDRDERSRHLDPLWSALEALPPPLVLAGDVNERPDQPVWQALSTRLRDAYVIGPGGPADTSTAQRPHQRIDGVFVSEGVEVVECHAVTAPDAARASDHLPVLAVLRH